MRRGVFRDLQTTTVIAVIFFTNILTDCLTHGQVNVEPNTALLNEGDPTELLCRYGQALTYCRIEIPGEKVLNLSPEWSKTPGFTYFGAGLQAGQCGVSIERVKASNNGEVKCSLGVQGEELAGKIELVVALRPQQPLIELLNKPNRDGYYEEGNVFQARCVVRDGRPAANITWLIDDYPAEKPISQMQFVASPNENNISLSTTIQEIQWHLGSEDDGRKLACRSHHQTDRDTLPPQEGIYQLRVRYPPVKQSEAKVYGLYLDHTAIVNVTIRANPAPIVEWTVNGVVIKQGNQEGRFSVYEPQYIEKGYYNVTLAIAGLTLEDTTKPYQLRATNALGTTDYQVRISSSSAPPSSGLEIGAIVGIVVALVILIVIILLVVFARATGRWCFGGATLNTDIGPDSEAQINPPQHDDLEGRDLNNGDEHIDTTHQSEEATPPVTDKLDAQKKAELKGPTANKVAPPAVPVPETALTIGQPNKKKTKQIADEANDLDNTNLKDVSTATTASNVEVAEDTAVPGAKTTKRTSLIPALSNIFRHINERGSVKLKHPEVPNENAIETEQNQNQNPEGTVKNDSDPKEHKQLVYAELVLKPADKSEPPPPKPATEYAEIMYVQKPGGEQNKI